MTFDDPRSAFNGADHFVDINGNEISNEDGPDVWYTDAYGRNGRTEPFAGSVRQRIAAIENFTGVDVGGPTIGGITAWTGSGRRTEGAAAAGQRRAKVLCVSADRSHRAARCPAAPAAPALRLPLSQRTS